MFEQIRAHWIVSSERTLLLNALHQQMAQRLAAMFPGGPVSSMATELATVAIHEIDAVIARPIQVQAGTITIKDHRG